jgi:hypothetical protein
MDGATKRIIRCGYGYFYFFFETYTLTNILFPAFSEVYLQGRLILVITGEGVRPASTSLFDKELPEIKFLIVNIAGRDTRIQEFLFKGLHHRERSAHVNVMLADVSSCILYDIFNGQGTLRG